MKTASVRELQHGLAALLASVERGDTVTVTRRGKVVACIVPPPSRDKVRWPDSMARMKRLFPDGAAAGTPPSLLVRADRDERS
ncbi:MAG: type II toxin-antitoxin system prevent-host-death family antitoxin [Pseudomonadota bacterium]